MTERIQRPFFSALLLMGLFLMLVGCGSRSANTSYYVLESDETTPVEALDKWTGQKNSLPRLQLRRVDMPGYLDRNSLVTREAGGVRLNLAEFHSWAEPLGVGAQRVLSEVLTPLLLKEGMLLQPMDDDMRGPLQIFVQVQRLDGPLKGEVVLDARWTVRDSDDKTLARGAFVDKEGAGEDYAGMVQAQSQLLKRLGTSMAQSIIKTLGSQKR